jgi:hypothetical protein
MVKGMVILRRVALGVMVIGGLAVCSWPFGAFVSRVYPTVFANPVTNADFVMVGFPLMVAAALISLGLYHIGREIEEYVDGRRG